MHTPVDKNQISQIQKEKEGIEQKSIYDKSSEVITQALKNIQKIYSDIPYTFLKHQTNPINVCNNLMKKRFNKIKPNYNFSNTFMYYKGKGVELDKYLQNQSSLKYSLKNFLENKNLQIKKLEKESENPIFVSDPSKNLSLIKMRLYNNQIKRENGMYSNQFSNTNDIDLIYNRINGKILCKMKDSNISNSMLFISNINLSSLNLASSYLSEQSIYIQQIKDFLLCSENDKRIFIQGWVKNIVNFFFKTNFAKNILWKLVDKIISFQFEKGESLSNDNAYNIEYESLRINLSLSFLENLFFSEIFQANQNLNILNVRQYVDEYLLKTLKIKREALGLFNNYENFYNRIHLDYIDVYFLIRAGKYEIIPNLLSGNIPLLNMRNLIEIYISNHYSIPDKKLQEIRQEDIHWDSDFFKQAIFNLLTKNKENPYEFLTQNPFDLVWYCFKMIKETSNDEESSMRIENAVSIQLSEIQEIIFSQIEETNYPAEVQAIILLLSLQFEKALNKLMTNINYNIDAISISYILTKVGISFDTNHEECNEFIKQFNHASLNKVQDPDLIYILLLLIPSDIELLANKLENTSKTHILTSEGSFLSREDLELKKALFNTVSKEGINQLKIVLSRLIESSVPTDSSVQLLVEAKKYEEAISQLIMIQIQYIVN